MPALPYHDNIPLATDIPAQSQPLFLENFDSIPILIDVDHYPFDINDDYGKHKKVTMPLQSAAPSTTANELVIYAKNTVAPLSVTPELFIRRVADGAEIPFTKKVTASSTGYTYLPSGVLIQWGQNTATGFSTVVNPNPIPTNTFTFQVPFSTNPSITFSERSAQNSASTNNQRAIQLTIGGPTTTSFTVNAVNTNTGGAANTPIIFKWIAIGDA